MKVLERRPVSVCIFSVIYEEDGSERERVTTCARGYLSKQDSDTLLVYREAEAENAVLTRIRIHGAHHVTVEKEGSIASSFSFAPMTAHNTVYRVGGYTLDGKLFSHAVDAVLTVNGWNIRLDYDLTLGGAFSHTLMEIRVEVEG